MIDLIFGVIFGGGAVYLYFHFRGAPSAAPLPVGVDASLRAILAKLEALEPKLEAKAAEDVEAVLKLAHDLTPQ